MTISSRTPEGMRNRCSLCGGEFRLEPSLDTFDAPCPYCGHLLWFKGEMNSAAENRWHRMSYPGFVIKIGKERLGPFPIELQRDLFDVISLLTRKKQLPTTKVLLQLVQNAPNWDKLLLELRMLLPASARRRWAYSAGAFLRRQYRRLFAKA
jgi:hypothetical protein